MQLFGGQTGRRGTPGSMVSWPACLQSVVPLRRFFKFILFGGASFEQNYDLSARIA